MAESIHEGIKQRFSKPLRVLLAAFFLFEFLPLLIALFVTILGYRFLPSTEWVSTTSGFRVAIGLVSGILIFGLSIIRRDAVPGSELKKDIVVLFCPFFVYFMGSRAAVVGGPIILALVAGHPQELAYTVGRADNHYEKHCYSPLELQDLIVGFDRVCGVSDEFRRGLATGTHIIVVGHGTRFGLFATDLRREN